MTFKNSVRTAKKTLHFTVTKINWLTLFKEIIVVYSEKRTKSTDIFSRQKAELLNGKAGGTHSYHKVFKGLLCGEGAVKAMLFGVESSPRYSYVYT
jgi:hypothetical protein